jgi:NADH-quinone oxidoreductase subunit L
MAELAKHFHGAAAMGLHGFTSAPFWLVLLGAGSAWFLYLQRPELPGRIAARLSGLHRLLVNKYYLDRLNEIVFAGGARRLGTGLWKGGDVGLIDGVAVNGSARLVGWVAAVSRLLQSGHIYTYAFGMIIGVLVLITLFVTLSAAR